MIPYNTIPILFKIGSIKIYSFGLMLAIAAFIFLILINKKENKIIKSEKKYILLPYIIIFAVLGARIIYLIVNYTEFSSVIEFISLWKGGLSGIGALTGGILGVFIFSKIQKINFIKLVDLIIPYIALSFAIGRIGCFLRGCCHGIQTNLPWGISYGENSIAHSVGLNVPVHPTQLYLMIGNLIIFLILLKIYEKKSKIQGFTFMLFLSLFSLQRILVDFLRYYPENNYIGKFTVFQIMYSVIFIISILGIFFTIHQGKKKRKL